MDASDASGQATTVAGDRPLGPDAATILATEHWSLLGTRTMLWNERMSRTATFLAVLSAAIVAIALVANATGFGPAIGVLLVQVAGASSGAVVAAGAVAFPVAWAALFLLQFQTLRVLRTIRPRFPTPVPDA
jgi:hypothetical protein